MASRKELLNQTNPFAMPGEDKPSLHELTGAMLSNDNREKQIDELEKQIISLKNDLENQTVDNAIVVRQDGLSKHYKNFELHETQLVIPDNTSETDWTEIGVMLLRMQGTVQWLLGDWLVYGMEQGWDDTYDKIKEIFGYEVESLWTYASVCRKVPALTRVKELSFSHHRAVTKFDNNPEIQQEWLSKAYKNSWSAKELISQIREAENPTQTTPRKKSWEKSIERLQENFSPKKWQEMSQADRKEAIVQLQSLVLQLEEMDSNSR